MVVMNRIRVSKRVEKKLAKGLVLLEASDFENVNLKDQEVEVQGQEGTFLGTAYLSQQNKGLGWFISKDKITFNQAFFEMLFRQAKEKRRAYYQDDLTTAFRLFNQEGDGFGGLTVDLYGDYAVFSWYNSYVYQIRQTISEAFRQVFPEVLGAYEKIRFKGLDYESTHVYGQEAPDFFTVLENGVLYKVFMNDGLMTGIFLDQHEVRSSLVDGLAMGKSLLNMFSYTAAFSVAATMGGASQTTSVDLAKRSRELSQAHFQANGISTDDHRFVVMDVFEYFKYAKRKGLTYDVIVLDPPSFARNKKQTFSVAKDYHKLISQSLEILNPGGIIIASTNAANVSRQKFTEQIDKGFAGRSYQILNKYGLPADFAYNKKDESSNYLKVISMKVSK
ncbi:class I SAM-dependent rRNA methyltransferase [Streptococcus pseudopneumoniae]|nr:class I SAM-dependent rRNA methyltransferase [Streptococcus pseudopneumoniae]